jgi:hypothetical protein
MVDKNTLDLLSIRLLKKRTENCKIEQVPEKFKNQLRFLVSPIRTGQKRPKISSDSTIKGNFKRLLTETEHYIIFPKSIQPESF